MSNLTSLIVVVVIGVGIWLYRRHQQPDLLDEVCNGLRYVALQDRTRGESAMAAEFERSMEAIQRAQQILTAKEVPDANELQTITRDVLHAMDYQVLERAGIARQNHKHACYEAVANLAQQLERLAQHQTNSAAKQPNGRT